MMDNRCYLFLNLLEAYYKLQSELIWSKKTTLAQKEKEFKLLLKTYSELREKYLKGDV